MYYNINDFHDVAGIVAAIEAHGYYIHFFYTLSTFYTIEFRSVHSHTHIRDNEGYYRD